MVGVVYMVLYGTCLKHITCLLQFAVGVYFLIGSIGRIHSIFVSCVALNSAQSHFILYIGIDFKHSLYIKVNTVCNTT